MYSNPNKRRLNGVEEYIHPIKKQKIVLYLDDYRPIRTIEVTNIGDKVCSGYLRGYFECKIGPVSDATIVDSIGYVTFLLPEDAAKLICNPILQRDCKFIIRQAESVHQPKIDPNVLKFEELNDHCFMHIASFLNLIDTVNLGKTSRRLQSVTQQIFQKTAHFSFCSLLNRKNLRTIFEETGSFIQSLRWRHVNDRQLDELSKYCQHVTRLELVKPNLHLDSIERNGLFFKNVDSLKIENADSSDARVKAIIASSIKLKSLEMICCYNVTGNFFYDWQNSQLEYLKIWRCSGMSPSSISHFATRVNQLTKYSSDIYDSFICCLTLPAKCLNNYTELGLALSLSTDDKLELLAFDELKQLRKIHLKCSNFHARLGYDVTFFYNYNKVFTAMSAIPTLDSMTVEKIIIDENTFICLGSIKNLYELTLNDIDNRVGKEMYSLIHVHLPKVTKLSIKTDNTAEETDFKSICEMISSLVDLKYFYHSSMTWEFLETIRQVRLLREQSPFKIGISEMMFNDPRKKAFAEMSKEAIILSLIE